MAQQKISNRRLYVVVSMIAIATVFHAFFR